MQVKLFIKAKNITLSVFNTDKIFSKREWIDENNLLEKFFPFLEEILTENNLEIKNIESFILETDIPEGYTTERIARNIIQTLNFSLES